MIACTAVEVVGLGVVVLVWALVVVAFVIWVRMVT